MQAVWTERTSNCDHITRTQLLIRQDIRRVNGAHGRALRMYCAHQREGLRYQHGEAKVLACASEASVDALIKRASASLFAVQRCSGLPSANRWWDADDLTDHLILARDIARWSPVSASILTGVDDDVIAALRSCGSTAIRECAAECMVLIRWQTKDLRRALSMLDNGGDPLGTTRESNASLLITGTIAKMTMRPTAISMRAA